MYANLPMAGSDKSEERRSGRSRQDTRPCLGDASRWNIAVMMIVVFSSLHLPRVEIQTNVKVIPV